MIVLAVSGVSAVGDISSRYDVLSIYGNPRSLKPIESVGNNSSQSEVLLNVVSKIEDKVASEHNNEPLQQVVSGNKSGIIRIQDFLSINNTKNIDSNVNGYNLNNIKDKMMLGIDSNIPVVMVKGNEPNVMTTSKSLSDEINYESKDEQTESQIKAYNYSKMISAYETTMMYAM